MHGRAVTNEFIHSCKRAHALCAGLYSGCAAMTSRLLDATTSLPNKDGDTLLSALFKDQ